MDMPAIGIFNKTIQPFIELLRSLVQEGGHPLTWICKGKYKTTHETQLVISSCVQNLITIAWSSQDMRVSILSDWRDDASSWPVWGCYRSTKEMASFISVIPREMPYPASNSVRFRLGKRAKTGVTKKDNYKRCKSNTLRIGTDAPTRRDHLNFGMWGNIVNIVTHPTFCQLVQGFRSSENPDFLHLHRLSWSPLQECKHYHATLRWPPTNAHHCAIQPTSLAIDGPRHMLNNTDRRHMHI